MNANRKSRRIARAARMSALLLVSGLLLGWLAVPWRGLAAAGDLDLSFGGSGYRVTPIGGGEDYGEAVVIQGDGKVIVAGSATTGTSTDFAAVRYTAAGELDPTFGGDGMVTTDFTTGPDQAYDAALQADGKLVLAGRAYSAVPYVALTRYDADGELDPSFSGDGRVLLYFDAADAAGTAVALQADGKIVVAGYVQIDGDYDIAVARFLPNGELDPSFDEDGRVVTPVGEGWERAYDLGLQEDGKIVVVGEDRPGDGSTRPSFVVLRYTSEGSLDGTFGAGGIATLAAGDEATAAGVALQEDGKIVVVGQIQQAGYDYFGIARYTVEGSLDPTFGPGYVMIAPGYGGYASDVVIQPDKMIVVAGRGDFSGSGDEDFTLMRLNWIGGRDYEFGTDGIVHSSLSEGDDWAKGVALQADGKIVAAGSAHNGSNTDFGAARYYGEEAPPGVEAELRRYTFSGGGGETSGASLSLRGSIGQPSVIGESSGSSLVVRSGYWHAGGEALRTTVTGRVTPEEGGYLLAADGRTAFEFPAGSVNTTVFVTFTQQVGPIGSGQFLAADASGSLTFAGNAFNLAAVAEGGAAVSSFLKPYTLTLDYVDRDWQGVGISSEGSLNLYRWEDGQGAWAGLLPCAGCVLDVDANRLTVRDDRSGDFALFGEIRYPVNLPLLRR